jgi:hypothetical protein
MTEHDDHQLERLVRASLDDHAGEVDSSVPVAARARTAARKHRAGWVVLAASAAVAAVAIAAVVVDRVSTPSADTPPVADLPSTTASPAAPEGWRAEYWKGIRIEVPSAWGWGTAPRRDGVGDDRDLYLCGGPGATRTVDGRSTLIADPSLPYVGRPIMLSDACLGGDVMRDPQAPYVWLGADLRPATSDVGNGYTQETVEVGGTTVTVGTDDPALREEILASATLGGPCAPALTAPPYVEVGEDGAQRAADSLLVCAYRSEDDGSYSLVYADELGAAAADATEDMVRSAPVITGDCLSPEGGEWVTLSARGDSGWSREYVVDLNCPAVTDFTGQMHRLEPAMVRPWAVDGLPVTLYGPFGGKGATFDSFIGMLG